MPATTSPTSAALYEETTPPRHLASHLACRWVRRVGDGPGTPVVPDGCTDLMWIADETGAHLIVAGPDTMPHPVQHGPATSIAAVRFRPGAAQAVLGVPLDAIRDERPELEHLWGRVPAERLAAAVAGAERPEDVLAGAVAERLHAAGSGDSSGADGAMRLVADVLGSTPEPSPVRELAERIGLSERQLHRRCLAAFGYGPKTLHRVLRFQRALARARRGDDLARVAHECGYADQAHLARDVSALTGTTLTALLAS